jgi:HEAT repeat protein
MTRVQDLAALVGKMPDPDKHGKLDGIAWPEAEKVYDEILQGGRENVVKLVGMLKEIDDGEDYKVRYVIHGLALYLCRPEKKKEREAFAAALVSQLGGDRPKAVQGFVVRELQVVGRKESLEALGKLLVDEELFEYAAMALLAIREGAVEPFRKALPAAKGKRRLAAVQALGILRDGESVEALRKAAADEDRDTRLAALWGLANIGDGGSADLVLKAGDAPAGWERIKATQACLLLAERLLEAGKKAEAAKIWRRLKETRTDPSEAYVREAAEKALQAAGG